MPKRYLVTGGSGFVGANLVRRLLEEGGEVHCILHRATDLWRLTDVEHAIVKHEGDLGIGVFVREAVRAAKPDVVYHVAAAGAFRPTDDAGQIFNANLLGTWNLIRACQEVGFSLFVNTGTSTEYGQKQFAMRETDLLEPTSLYDVTKAAQTLLCQHLARETDNPMVTIRLFSVYGPWDKPGRLVPMILLAALRNRPIKMADGLMAHDFVHVDDVVEVYRRLEGKGSFLPRVLNVGTGVQNTLCDVVNAAAEATGRRVVAEWGAMASKAWDSRTWVADTSLLLRTLDWTPPIRLVDGLRDTYRWLEGHCEHYPE